MIEYPPPSLSLSLSIDQEFEKQQGRLDKLERKQSTSYPSQNSTLAGMQAKLELVSSSTQWNLRIADMLRPGILPFIEDCPLFGGFGIIGKWNLKCVLYREVFFYCVLYSECPLLKVPLYTSSIVSQN